MANISCAAGGPDTPRHRQHSPRAWLRGRYQAQEIAVWLSGAVGIELKPTYYRQAVRNLKAAEGGWRDNAEEDSLFGGEEEGA